VIANGIRAGRRTAFRDHPPLEQPAATALSPADAPSQLPMAVPVVVGGDAACQDDCCRDE